MTFLAELRSAASASGNLLTRHQLRNVASDLESLIDTLHSSPSLTAMQKVNCAWARAVRLLCYAKNNNGNEAS